MAVSTFPSGMHCNVISDGLEPNQGHYLAKLSGTYTISGGDNDPPDVVFAADKSSGGVEPRFGIKPSHVKVTNLTDRVSIEAVYGSASGLLTEAAGTRTYVAHGLTLGERSLGISPSINSIITSGDTITVEVWS
jgi:hypothetical protein